jgi:molecular chaperone GrpE
MNKDELEKEIPDMADEAVTDETTDTDVEFEEVNEEGEMDARTTIKKLREKVSKLESEKKEYLDLSQRLRADYMNLKKEIDHERMEGRKLASKRIIEELLPVLDAYDMAQGNKEAWEAVDKNWRFGIEHIFSQLKQVLEREGVTQFGAVGEAFDPSLHESMEHLPVEEESQDGTIMQILQKGYRMKDVVLRPARVKTGEFRK